MKIHSRQEWGARYRRGFRPAPLPARELYLHHSVTGSAGVNASFGSDAATVRTLENIGQNRFGGGISYTFCVTEAGRVFEGHGIDRQGAHTGGRNSIARAICLVGNYDVRVPPPQMVAAVTDLVRWGRDQGWWGQGLTGGHRDAPGASTACPGRHAYALIGSINRAALLGKPPSPKPRKVEPVIIRDKLAPGDNYGRIICPVGRASAIYSRGWVSITAVGGATSRVAFQMDADNNNPPPGAGDIWDNTLESSSRDWKPLPSGTEYLEYWVSVEGSTGEIAVELE